MKLDLVGLDLTELDLMKTPKGEQVS